MIAEILRKGGYQVVAEAADGDEAIEAYNKFAPDFVTMDVVMPERNGIEACRKIIEGAGDAKIIIVSAMAHEQLLMDAINAGARDYIMKPFSPEDLLKAVGKLFEGEDEGEDAGMEAGHGR